MTSKNRQTSSSSCQQQAKVPLDHAAARLVKMRKAENIDSNKSGNLLIYRINKVEIYFLLYSYKVLVIGGGAGGCSAAAKFAKKLGKGKVGVIEPNDVSKFALFSFVFPPLL